MRWMAEIEVLVLAVIAATGLYFLVTGGMTGGTLEMVGGLAVYFAVWVYALVRASYSGPGPA